MKIFNAQKLKELDQFTIKNAPIKSIDLMERAAGLFSAWFQNTFKDTRKKISILIGNGNNGGDGLAIARMLHHEGYLINCFIFSGVNKRADNITNLNRLKKLPLDIFKLDYPEEFHLLEQTDIIIDAIFGVGISRPVQDGLGQFFNSINRLTATKIAIDIPSGMHPDTFTQGEVIHADYTFAIDRPKFSFFFAEHANYLGEWIFAKLPPIPQMTNNFETKTYYLTKKIVQNIYKNNRAKFSHKGSYGHLLLAMGSYGKTGALLLAGEAALRTGVGLLTLHAPKSAYSILQSALPEAMVQSDHHDYYISNFPLDNKYSSIGIGCGIDQKEITQNALYDFIDKSKSPFVLDADGLNLLAKKRKSYYSLPIHTIITPHKKEFERLFGKYKNNFELHEAQIEFAQKYQIIIILKGAHTCIALPNGDHYFNSTGNPGMATAGSGDVLTGIIASFLAQKYSPKEAALLGVFIHGKAADLALEKNCSFESLIARDIINHLGQAFISLT